MRDLAGLCSWKHVDISTDYEAEFRQGVMDVASKGEAPLAQIANDL